MESSLESTNNKLLSTEASEPAADKSCSRTSLNLLYLFFAALAIRLWFNFGTEHINAAAASDASEYLRYATALSKLSWSALSFGPEWKEFVITGPAFPFFLWLCSFATFSPVNSQQLDAYLVAQSAISALTALLIAVIGKNIWNTKVGFLGGYIAAFYPAFIVNSGRLYSETFATCIEVAALAILTTSKPHEQKYKYALLGALLVVLQLTRSSMILFSAACIVLAFIAGAQASGLSKINWRSAITNLAIVLLGSLAVLAPWLWFEKTAFNKLSLVVDRVGHYNLFVGTNSTIQGFLSYPYPDGRGIEKKSFFTLVKEAYKTSPNRFLKLMLDKPARLYKFPWNDFRTPIGPIKMAGQVAFHQIVLLLAIIGLGLGLIFSPKEKHILGKAAVIGALAINLPFLAFITVPRYNLMAMPSLILLGAAGVCALISILRENKLARAPKIVAASALFLFVFLRDDLRAPFGAGDSSATALYFVQGTDLLTRSLIATIALIILLAGLWLCVNLLAKQSTKTRAIGHICVALLSIALLPLTLFPQRANGRMKEGILTLSRPGEQINGKIPINNSMSAGQEMREWFLLIDSDLGQLPRGNFNISLNGIKVIAPAMPSIAALDNWHYLKNHKPGRAYLECTYIFDCLSSVANLNNSELRQWFVIPVSAEQRALITKQKIADISISQNSSSPSNFFSAAEHTKHKNVIPSRAIYSWEKAFYGVENDQGLTCPRYDEIVDKRNSQWSLSYKGKSEALSDLDLNVRLISVKSNHEEIKTTERHISVKGNEKTDLPLGKLELQEGELAGVSARLSYAESYRSEAHFSSELNNAKPLLQLHWLDADGREQIMDLPYLSKPQPRFSVFLPLDLKQINGSQYRVSCSYPDKDCQIELTAKVLDCHPLFSEQELF
ncbi:MAG: hypothetical protein Q8T09_06600 [Candidatus Melainabacteria bacterium]|nr:hypothetical protein [Candidatus Melainabacteria bacterium]